MPKLTRDKFENWRRNTLAAIESLNKIIGNDLTGEGFYNLEYRGKNHKIVLTHDGYTIARGIYAIERAIENLFDYYNMKERRKNGNESR